MLFYCALQRAFKALTYPQHVALSVLLHMWTLIWCEQRKNRWRCNFSPPLSQSKPASHICMRSVLNLDFQSTIVSLVCKSNWSYLHLRHVFDSSSWFHITPTGGPSVFCNFRMSFTPLVSLFWITYQHSTNV